MLLLKATIRLIATHYESLSEHTQKSTPTLKIRTYPVQSVSSHYDHPMSIVGTKLCHRRRAADTSMLSNELGSPSLRKSYTVLSTLHIDKGNQ